MKFSMTRLKEVQGDTQLMLVMKGDEIVPIQANDLIKQVRGLLLKVAENTLIEAERDKKILDVVTEAQKIEPKLTPQLTEILVLLLDAHKSRNLLLKEMKGEKDAQD